MPTVIFRIVWPFLQGYLLKRGANYVAEQLNKRRAAPEAEEPELVQPPEPEAAEPPPPVEPVEEEAPAPPEGLSTEDTFWFTMSGVLLGGALAIIVASVTRPQN